MDQTKIALALFIVTYIFMISVPNWRYIIALISAGLFLITGIMPLDGIVGAINWNVLLMLIGTMGTVSLFIESKMPIRMSDYLLNKSPNVMWLAVIMSLFAGIVSAFIDNVATLLMIAPVALAICKKLNISPVPMLISISVSSNLQGAATLVGDTTSILLGGYAGMNFLDFFFMDGKFSIFWAVELGAIATIPVIVWIFRKNQEPIPKSEIMEVQDFFPTILLVGTVVLLIAASFIPEKPDITNGLICCALCIIGVVRAVIREKSLDVVGRTVKEVDYITILLLAGLFIVIDGITRAGVIDMVSNLFVRVGGSNLFLMYSLIVWGSVLISAFIDNIPYVATMLPVVTGIAQIMGCDPTVLYFGLLSGATLGGNLTPIGASANIAAIGILNKNGYSVTTGDFMKIGLPFTLVAVLAGYIFIWFVWA